MAAVTNAQTIQAPPGAPDTAHLTGTEGLVLAAIVVAAVLGAGGIIAWARSTETTKPDEPGGSLVRSWIAVGLMIGLLALCAIAFAIGDKTTRSALVGALTASVGAAIAFYFSAKASETAVAAAVKGHKAQQNPGDQGGGGAAGR